MTESYKMLQLLNIFSTYTQSEICSVHLGSNWMYMKGPLYLSPEMPGIPKR